METYDVIVIGGGPAGLQAALTLGRVHRDVLVLDSGRYRNDPADQMHNFLGHDGTSPAELRAAARKDLTEYATVEVVETAALEVAAVGSSEAPRFVVRTPDGEFTARRLVLATGLTDDLPPTPGLAELFGSVAAHCPYCHGHEYAGTPVGILGAGPHVPRLALLMERIASRLVVFADGAEVDAEARATFDAHGVEVLSGRVVSVERSGGGTRVVLDDGSGVEVGGLMVAPTFRQSAPFAEQLGLGLQGSGCVAVDPFGRTSLPGVFAVGDMAHTDATPMPMTSVMTAAASGLVAAATLVGELLDETGH